MKPLSRHMKRQLIKALRLRLRSGYSERLRAGGVHRTTNVALWARGLLRYVGLEGEAMVITAEGMRVARRLLEHGE